MMSFIKLGAKIGAAVAAGETAYGIGIALVTVIAKRATNFFEKKLKEMEDAKLHKDSEMAESEETC